MKTEKSLSIVKMKSKIAVRSEFLEHRAFCQYLKIKKMVYVSDLIDKLSKSNGNIFKDFRSESMADVTILEPNSKFHGCIIEMKKTNFKMYKKNMDFISEHIKNQARILDILRNKGYYCFFAKGSNDAISIFEKYLKDE